MPNPIEKPIECPNSITEIRKKVNDALVTEQTPEKPVTRTTTHNIANLQAKIAKYENVIAQWQAKIDPCSRDTHSFNHLKSIIKEYNAL